MTCFSENNGFNIVVSMFVKKLFLKSDLVMKSTILYINCPNLLNIENHLNDIKTSIKVSQNILSYAYCLKGFNERSWKSQRR